MKTRFLILAVQAAAMSMTHAAVYLEDDFSTYTNGDLVGQGDWTQTSNVETNPIQVLDGAVLLPTTGQDAFKAFTSSVPHDSGFSLYTGFAVLVETAAATGDYFVHLSNPAGTTTNFYQRFFVRSSGTGMQFGLLDTSGTNAATTWGTTELSFDTIYHVVVAWNFVDGTANDTFALYVNPTSTIQGENTPYLTHTWTSTSVAEPTALAAANFRQGGNNSAPDVSVFSLIVTDDFATAAVPEPSTTILVGLGVTGCLFMFRRRRRA